MFWGKNIGVLHKIIKNFDSNIIKFAYDIAFSVIRMLKFIWEILIPFVKHFEWKLKNAFSKLMEK